MHRFGTVTRSVALSVVLAVAGLASRAAAQCGVDNLDSLPCCSPLSVTLPVFPPMQQTCRYVCFRDCATAVSPQICVTIGTPQPVIVGGNPVCGVYLINFQFRTCGGNQLLWQGNIRAQYARNWLERDAVTTRGVWRFLLNGDLVPSSVILNFSNANIRPPCVLNFGRAYFSGYLDYAADCALPNSWLAAWVLNHECDQVTHAAGTNRQISSGSHPTRSYIFVGPSAGFVVDPANGPWIPGAITGDSIRKNNWSTVPNICLAEEIVLAPGQFNPVNLSCECVPSPPGAPTQFGQTVVQAFGGCGSRVDTMNPPMSPFPFSQKAIGYWTTPNTFPSPSHLFVDHGTVLYNDGCSNQLTTQYVEGVTTLTSGVAVMAYSGAGLGNNIVDLATSNTPNGTVRVGIPHVSWYLIGLNF
jgi:hypothetical protein